MDDDCFEPTGPGWQRPAWRQLLLWLRWRPWYWLLGEIFHWCQVVADRREFGPFRRMYGIGAGDGAEDAAHYVVAVHQPDQACACGSEWQGRLHHRVWFRCGDYRWLADRWDEKDQRWYLWVTDAEAPTAIDEPVEMSSD